MSDGLPRDAQALAAPPAPTDLIASALHLPLQAIDHAQHRGKKIRTTGQILAFDVKTSLLLLSAASTGPSTTHTPTLLVNVSVPLLGMSPAATDVSGTSDNSWSYAFTQTSDDTASTERPGKRERPRLRIERGEWVTVVGWLEGVDERTSRKVKKLQSYEKPLDIVLEAIHIAQSRPPPVDAIYRGQL